MRIFVALVLSLALGSFLSINNVRAESSQPMKGYVLFSWFGMECSARPSLTSAPNDDSWCYALVFGTNRAAAEADLVKAKVGVAELEKKLAALPRGAELIWNNAVAVEAPKLKLALPPDSQQLRVRAAAKRAGIALTVAVAPPPAK